MIVKLNSRARRAEFYRAGKKFNRDRKLLAHGTTRHKIFINEKLTSDQKQLLYNTKSFARNRDYAFAWFFNGLIHLKKRSNSRLIYIRSQDDLDFLADNMRLKIYYQNVRGLKSKTHELLQSVESNDYDIIAMTETWLREGIFNREMFDERYEVYRETVALKPLQSQMEEECALQLKNRTLTYNHSASAVEN